MSELLRLVPARQGHFLLESGHHGELWLDLELLLARPEAVRESARDLAGLVGRHGPDLICGPLVEGAFVALMVAEELKRPFGYASPGPRREGAGLFPVRYRIPRGQRPGVHGRRVAVVNDVIGAGSAVRGTLEDVRACGGEPVVLASLAVLGLSARQLAEGQHLALEALTMVPNTIWEPAACPLCARGVPLSDPEGS